MSASTRGSMIKGIYAVECEGIFCMKKLELTYMDGNGRESNMNSIYEDKHYVKHELRPVLLWLYSLTDLCVKYRYSPSWCRIGGSPVSSDYFDISHVQYYMT